MHNAMIPHDLRIALVQTEILWCQPKRNRQCLGEQLSPLAGQVDLVVLPEMFTSGFNATTAETVEEMDGATVAWMHDQARLLDAAVTGSLPIRTEQGIMNRLVWVRPDGQLDSYDKRHLFRYAGEHHHYQPGRARLVITWRGWRIFPLICYDLRFPVFCRNRYQPTLPQYYDYDLQLVVANWPSSRTQAWRTLLRARAIENQSYVAGVNRVGQDGLGLDYGGASAVITMAGETQIEMGSSVQVVTTVLDRHALSQAREQFPVLLDADAFTLADQGRLL